jgi:hypothetical protein
VQWLKKGLLIEPASAPWMATHAAVAFVQRRGADERRIYFTSRDAEGRSRTGYADLDMRDPFGSLRISERPVLTPGPLGAFDDRGAMGSWLVERGDELFMYYIGWNLGVTVPFYSFTGLARSTDGGESFERVTRGLAVPRDDVDPFIATNPCVLHENGLWRMWYISGVRWVIENGQPKHYYHIKYDESPDGLTWKRLGIVCIDFEASDEYAIARPCVVKDGDTYKMWYSVRGRRYRIGYAESADGLLWERLDERAGIGVSEAGWDSDMIEYAFVFDHGGDRYMLYNGNDYGRTGLGLAVLQG